MTIPAPTCITKPYGVPSETPTIVAIFRPSARDGRLRWAACEYYHFLTPQRVLRLHMQGVEAVCLTIASDDGPGASRADFMIAELLPWARRHILDGVDLSNCESLCRLHQYTGSDKVWKALKTAAAASEWASGEGWQLDAAKGRVYQAQGINRNGRTRWRSYRKGSRTFTRTR